MEGPEIRVDRELSGAVSLLVTGADGDEVYLVRPCAGREVEYGYRDCVWGVYSPDGELRQVFCNVRESIRKLKEKNGRDFPGRLSQLADYLRRDNANIRIVVNIKGGVFQIISMRDDDKLVQTSKLADVLGPPFEMKVRGDRSNNFPLGLGVKMTENGCILAIGLGDKYYETQILGFLDTQLLDGPLDEPAVGKLLCGKI